MHVKKRMKITKFLTNSSTGSGNSAFRQRGPKPTMMTPFTDTYICINIYMHYMPVFSVLFIEEVTQVQLNRRWIY